MNSHTWDQCSNHDFRKFSATFCETVTFLSRENNLYSLIALCYLLCCESLLAENTVTCNKKTISHVDM
jgi:hypothetical protein